MNVRGYAKRRHRRRLVLEREPTLRQLLASLEAYARARDQAGAAQDAVYGHLRAVADDFAAAIERDLRLAGAAYVHVSWDLAANSPTYHRVDPGSILPAAEVSGELYARLGQAEYDALVAAVEPPERDA